jgi:tellurite resistance protein TehA-like permease
MSLGKVAKELFPLVEAIPHVKTSPGDIFYIVGVLVGIILWGFAIVWFVVAVMMISLSGGFPFNMGWWGFIFPIGTSLSYSLNLTDICV